MSRNYGIIENGVVARVILVTPEALAEMVAAEKLKVARLESAIDVTDLTDASGGAVGVGHLYDSESQSFSAPPEPEEQEETPSAEARLAKLEEELAALKAKG